MLAVVIIMDTLSVSSDAVDTLAVETCRFGYVGRVAYDSDMNKKKSSELQCGSLRG